MDSPQRLPTAERRRQIAEAALRILSSRGASRLTAAALAREVGITDGAIFRHYKNKEEIVDAAIELFETTLKASLPPATGEPLTRLREFVIQRLTLVRRHPELMRLAFNDRLAEAAGESRSARVAAVVGRSAGFVHECIVEAQARGEIAHHLSPTILVWMVIGVIRGAARGGPQNVPGEQELQQSPPDVVWSQLEPLLHKSP
jgi:AcrR family transcriptional regulator